MIRSPPAWLPRSSTATSTAWCACCRTIPVWLGPGSATARTSLARSLLHIATDWPGHFPASVQTVRALIAAGAEVDARFVGCRMQSAETPLHWAASTGDLDVLDALLDAGADIEAPGAIIGGGTPLADAVAFG